jgi:Tfp pilus assembly protein PilZ
MNMSVSAEQFHKTIINHRQGKRHRTFSLVEIKCRHGSSPGLMYNISRDGMYVLSTNVPKLNDSVQICISLFNKRKPVIIPGMVVHCNKHGFGLLFRELDDSALEVVKKYLHRKKLFQS